VSLLTIAATTASISFGMVLKYSTEAEILSITP